LFQGIKNRYDVTVKEAWLSLRAGRAIIAAIGLTFILSAASFAQVSSGAKDVAAFFRSITGEWIGTCEQSTDGEKAENKYFHAVIKQVDPSTFSSKFEYYRFDKAKNAPLKIGDATVITTVAPDGSAKAKITGEGIVLVNEKPKDQSHELQESLVGLSSGGLQGQGTGKVSVKGMPLGLGKNGKVESSKSNWNLDNGVLTIDQNLKVGFRALFIKKSFDMTAHYTARRGTDVASLITGATQVSARPTIKS